MSKKITIPFEKAFKLMATAKSMTELYEREKDTTSKYVHATSRGHESAQLALALHLEAKDYVAPYYRDDSLLLGIGMTPKDLMLQLLAKVNDPFSGGRTYYSHPSLNDTDKPKIPHQSSATGMQAIPTAGVAMGIQYREQQGLATKEELGGIAVCSIGDSAMTEGEISEAMHMAALKQFPLLMFVQDNGWDISANRAEVHHSNAVEYANGFTGIEAVDIDGTNFEEAYKKLGKIIKTMRKERRPFLVRMDVPLLNHHTSGVRKEWYRDDLEEAAKRDPYPILKGQCLKAGMSEKELDQWETEAGQFVQAQYESALSMPDPQPADLLSHDFAPTPIMEERGERAPEGAEPTVMVDAALFAIKELMAAHPEALLYGQDVGGRLGGVFREAATLAQKFGDERVFNTPIQEAFIIGSTVGMSATGLKPFVEVQFADYLWPGMNQLFTEVSRSYYLSNGKWPVSTVIRVPIGAYGSGGPFHSSSIETAVTSIRGIKIAYPSTGADLKGLMKSAFYDPNPVVIFEHKGLYWSKIPGTEGAKTPEPSEDYIIPFGNARMALEAEASAISAGETAVVIAYGMGVYWAQKAAEAFPGQISILDLRTLAPWDRVEVMAKARTHGRVLVLTEECSSPSFAQSVQGAIAEECFEFLDAPVQLMGAVNVPAIPLNTTLEQTMLPNAEKVEGALRSLLAY
ncbi:MAG: 2-oxoisovalerate dehydrogenase subunit beta [Flavobacteriales bacterium UBA4585]|nr:MAG: 2-oxoisovalerate dehydrogenase subunit beta [Flavobacteriales bacterium UBA4585]